ncbi:MAG: hypothetical protein QOD66_2010, partial [Solirubrobacteraceae bacterium]|nr:hypothetical protein [Solirubrobacteraceae bacterium]
DAGTTWSVVALPIPASDPTFMRPVQASGAPAVLILPQRTGPLFVSTDDGRSWSARPVSLPGDYVTSLSAARVSNAAVPVIYLGTGLGHLWRSADLGVSWEQLSVTNPFALSVRDIAIDAAGSPGPSAEHVFVALGVDAPQEYANRMDVGGVVSSTDSGGHWTDVGQALSTTSVNALLLRGSTLFAGTNDGVEQNIGGRWSVAGRRFPHVRVTDLFASADEEAIFATTYGRGTWRAITPRKSAGQIRAVLRRELVPHGRAARIGALLRRRGFSASIRALTAGRVLIRWYLVRHNGKPKRALVAIGRKTFTEAGSAVVKIALTAPGRRLLNHASRLTLTAEGAFTPVDQAAVLASGRFTLRRR